MKSIGSVICEIRKKKKISQIEFAKMCGISRVYISRIENGHQVQPSQVILDKMCKVLDVPMPILSFLCLEDKDVNPKKLTAFHKIKPATNALIKEFFLQ
jgi:transcriptional regulator with XRE-family HTH domain